jgi:hypothetical protein
LILLSIYLCLFAAEGWHQHGLALATSGALLLAVDPFLKSLKNREIAQLAKADPNDPPEVRAAVLEAQIQLFVEHSPLAFWATMAGAVFLAVGFLADFYSEINSKPVPPQCDPSANCVTQQR